MTINKRLIRNIKKNKLFFIGSVFLCALTVSFIIASTTTGSTMIEAVDQFNRDFNVENAQFTTENPINKSDIQKLQETYDVQIEQMKYIDIDIDDTTLRVFKENKKINLPQLKEGKYLADKNSILINNDYAKENYMEIGSILQLRDVKYTISGYYTRPDYVYMLKSLSDLYVNKSNFGIALLEEESFSKLSGIKSYYSVIYNKDNTVKFRKEINSKYKMTSYIDQDNNIRINRGIKQGPAISGMATSFSPILLLLNMGFIAVALSRMVKKERGNIGILAAFGYKKNEIALYYVKYTIIIGVLGSLLGVIIGNWITQPFLSMYTSEFNFPIYQQKHDILILIIVILLPTMLFSLTAFGVVLSMIKKTVVELLRGSSKNIDTKSSKILLGKSMKNSTKYGIRAALRNKGRSIVFIFGIFVASVLILSGIIMYSSCKNLLNTQLNQLVRYNYAYFLESVEKDFSYHTGQPFLTSDFESKYSGESIQLIGIDFDSNSKYYPLSDESGKELNENLVYISRALSELLSISEGDTLSFIDPVTLEEYSIKIGGVANNRTQKTIYMTRENANKFLGYESGSYNGIYSDKKLNIDESLLSLTRKGDEVSSAFQNFLEPVMATIYILITLGVILGIIVISIITTMILDENTANISMLKVLGYKTKEIVRMVLNINYFMVFIGYMIAVPIVIKFCEVSLKSNIKSMSLFIEVYFTNIEFITGLLIVYLTYFITLLISKRKVLRISMMDSLKENRE